MNIPTNVELYANEQDALRHHAASPENLRILAAHQIAFDAAHDAHAARKVGSLKEAADPLYELIGLIPGDHNLHRDFIDG